MTKCSFCGFEFDETKSSGGCNGCPFKGGCKNIKCPNCGFEMVPEPAWLHKLKRWGKKENG